MRRIVLASLAPALSLVALLACSSGRQPITDEPLANEPGPAPPPRRPVEAGLDFEAAAPEKDEPWTANLERCGNGIDDDGDGLVDEVCAPSFFLGVFAPGGGFDSAGHAAKLSADVGRTLSVVQTYRATASFDTVKVGPELATVWAAGSTPHLYLEPDGYTAAQIANGADAVVTADFARTANAIGDALVAHPSGRLLVSFGAEMNGTWTSWGCKVASTAQFIAFYRKMVTAVSDVLATRSIDPRRVRWVYAPNNISTNGCGSPAAYYPGHAYTDYLGISAYRQSSESVDVAVMAPCEKLMDDLAYPTTWRKDRFIVLQTGSKTSPGDRGAWLSSLVTKLAADDAYAGVIPFDTSDDPARDWAIMDNQTPPQPRAGYAELVQAAKGLPAVDAALEHLFEPYFWDVRPEHAEYAEVQALRAAKVTSGCSAAPPLFCPDDAISRADAASLLAAVTKKPREDILARLASDPVRRGDLANAILGVVPAKKADLDRLAVEAKVEPVRPATRAEAARWMVHTARIAPAPRLP